MSVARIDDADVWPQVPPGRRSVWTTLRCDGECHIALLCCKWQGNPQRKGQRHGICIPEQRVMDPLEGAQAGTNPAWDASGLQANGVTRPRRCSRPSRRDGSPLSLGRLPGHDRIRSTALIPQRSDPADRCVRQRALPGRDPVLIAYRTRHVSTGGGVKSADAPAHIIRGLRHSIACHRRGKGLLMAEEQHSEEVEIRQLKPQPTLRSGRQSR